MRWTQVILNDVMMTSLPCMLVHVLITLSTRNGSQEMLTCMGSKLTSHVMIFNIIHVYNEVHFQFIFSFYIHYSAYPASTTMGNWAILWNYPNLYPNTLKTKCAFLS